MYGVLGAVEGAGALYVRLGLEKLREPRLPELVPPPARAHASDTKTPTNRNPAVKATQLRRAIRFRIDCLHVCGSHVLARNRRFKPDSIVLPADTRPQRVQA